MLDLPEPRVRELARAALVELAPITARGVEPEWRAEIADYVLGQQAGPEATATRGHLRRSEPARAWAGSLLDSLDGMLGDEPPAIPGVRERGRRAAGRRRRLVAAVAAALALLAVGLLLWPIGLLGGGGDDGDVRQASASARRATTGTAAGVALVAQRAGGRQLIVQATLPASRSGEAYEVWLYNSRTDARSLGAQVSDARGSYQGVAPLPADFRRYSFIDVSRERVDRDRSHSGRSVLRGRTPALRRARPRRGQAAIVGQVVLTPPGRR